MKKVLASLLGWVVLVFASSAQEKALDAKFAGLLMWASNLNHYANVWNEQCHENFETEECQQTRLILFAQFTYFIECANRYEVTGSDCRTDIRSRIIKHYIREFQYNLDYAGQMLEGKKESNRDAERKAIRVEEDQLKKDADKCEPEYEKL
jgi:hypothetical protein